MIFSAMYLHTSNNATSLAFDREHRAKRARIEATNGLVTEAQSGYRYMERGIASTSRAIEGTTTRILTETANMSTAVDALNVGSTTSLGNIGRTTQSLIDEGTREDKPTGHTPRKRPRRVVEDLPPTEHRDILIRRFRSRGMSSVGSETFLAEHLPLPEEEGAESPVVEAMRVDSPAYASPSDDENRPESIPGNSPPALVKSLASSSSSSTSTETVALSLPPSIPALKQPSRSALPQLGTLTDSKAANVVRTRPQRTRRTFGQR